MIDRIIETAETLYKKFLEPEYHSEHVLCNVTVMDRIFDFRDKVAPSSLISFKVDPRSGKDNSFALMRKHLKEYFKTNSAGVLHLTNCCYGFWYSKSTDCYYYIDPYGMKKGKAFLGIFPTLCQMVHRMCLNKSGNATGFFIHEIHVESINVSPDHGCREDPMWIYLDYHWSFKHTCEDKTLNSSLSWNNYNIEIPNLIYSVWGTIGCYDPRLERFPPQLFTHHGTLWS